MFDLGLRIRFWSEVFGSHQGQALLVYSTEEVSSRVMNGPLEPRLFEDGSSGPIPVRGLSHGVM